ncbi:hypothetical protein JOD67_006620 [Tenggerimyces flavus]|nr:hypothetical protein [Tenggerimyces flavus]
MALGTVGAPVPFGMGVAVNVTATAAIARTGARRARPISHASQSGRPTSATVVRMALVR